MENNLKAIHLLLFHFVYVCTYSLSYSQNTPPKTEFVLTVPAFFPILTKPADLSISSGLLSPEGPEGELYSAERGGTTSSGTLFDFGLLIQRRLGKVWSFQTGIQGRGFNHGNTQEKASTELQRSNNPGRTGYTLISSYGIAAIPLTLRAGFLQKKGFELYALFGLEPAWFHRAEAVRLYTLENNETERTVNEFFDFERRDFNLFLCAGAGIKFKRDEEKIDRLLANKPFLREASKRMSLGLQVSAGHTVFSVWQAPFKEHIRFLQGSFVVSYQINKNQ